MRPANLCILCKGGRNLCGNNPCPLLPRIKIAPEVEKKISTEFFGPVYNIFVGRHGYPNVSIGPVAALEEKERLDSPANWFGMEYGKIVEIQSFLLRSRQKENIKSSSRLVLDSQELALASTPTDTEMVFRKKPIILAVSFSDIVQPMGPSAQLSSLRIAENTKISPKVEKIVNDDLKTTEAVSLLYQLGIDVYKLSTILSSGILGQQQSKKLVPTRWSITAIDDMIGKKLIAKVKEFPQLNEYLVFESQYLDNHIIALFMPGNWEFENFESWAPGSTWSFNLKSTEIIEEYEPFEGRKSYAELQGGGYYASRIACLEKLNEMRRQARVVVFREIYEGYTIPLGVWVVRQTARNAYTNPKRFNTKEEALEYLSTRLRISLDEYRKRSRVLKQKSIEDFLHPS